MKKFKEKVIGEIIRMGKKDSRLKVPAIVLAAVFLTLYHAVRNFCMECRYHPVRQRILSVILILSLLAGNIELVNLFAATDGQALSDTSETSAVVSETATEDAGQATEETETETETQTESTQTEETETETETELTEEVTALLAALPDPLTYLSSGTADESMIDREQLEAARKAADVYLAAADEVPGTLGTLLERLEGLEHIRDTEADCPDTDCLIHYPQIIQERMAEDETPELLTLEDLVEDYGLVIEEEAVREENASVRRSRAASISVSDGTVSALSSESTTSVKQVTGDAKNVIHPKTLMITSDNENNAHTGEADGDMDATMSSYKNPHPVEIAFYLDELPTQSAYLAVKAYDVDEDYGETDYVYLNDDIYLGMDQTNGWGESYNDSTIGYLSGTNNTWNTTVLEIPIEKLQLGKNVISVTVATGWVVKVDWMQLILDGGTPDENVEEFALELADSATEGSAVTVNALVTVKQNEAKTYFTEYTLTQVETGNALDACFGQVTDTMVSESVGLSLPLDSASGLYQITGVLKDENEQIKAIDSVSFYFTQGVGLGPKVSYTLTPDTYTNSDVTISVSAEDVPEAGITDAAIAPETMNVTENGSYTFTVSYRQDGEEKTLDYSVTVSNIDRTPPVISYTAITVNEEEACETVEELFAEALTVTDDCLLGAEPVYYTIPEDISYLPGTKTVTVTASDYAGNTAVKDCEIIVEAKPARLTMGTLTAVSGSKDSFTLNAVLNDTGAKTIVETGFVWGIMQNPTLNINNGTVTTASAVTAKGGTLTATATGLLSGVTYYARAYAKTEDGSVTYSDFASFGFGIPSYGIFSVSDVSGSTFTVTRTGGSDGEQTVYYRTVNGSAIGGTHFIHQQGTLTFADGETEKTVKVTEKTVYAAYNSDSGTGYSNADRTYSLEIYRVTGGGNIDADGRSQTRTMTKNSSYTVDRSIYTTERSVTNVAATTGTKGKYVADGTKNQGATETNVNFLTNRKNTTNYNMSSSLSDYYTDASLKNYLNATASGWYYRYMLLAYEEEDGYEHVYFGTSALADTYYSTSGGGSSVSGLAGQLWACTFQQGQGDSVGTYYFPSTGTGGGENSYKPYKSSGACNSYNGQNYVKLGLGDTCYVYFGASGSGTDIWYVDGLTSYALVYDDTEPVLLGVAPMAGGTYLPGDPITVSLVFDEIVDSANSSLAGLNITTNVGILTYAGGADTNVLYFTGNVESEVSLSGSSALTVTGISDASGIRDMCSLGGSGTTFTGGTTNVIVDATKPTVTITANTSGSIPTHSATITATGADTVQYAWSDSATLPAYGWSSTKSGATLTESLDSGTDGTAKTWYLHVLASSPTGATTHVYKTFSFKNLAITRISVLSAGASSGTDVSDVWRTYKYIAIRHAGQTNPTTLTWYRDGEELGTVSITSTSNAYKYLRVTENGTYTATLTDSYGNVVSKSIEVTKIDTVKPTVTIQSGSSTDASVIYPSLSIGVLPEDERNGSGVAKVEYAWTGSAAISSAASDWAELTADGDGGYTAAYIATETTKTAKYLHVRVTDNAGNVSTIATSGPYMMKAAAAQDELPAITVTGNPSSWAKSAELTWTAKKGSADGSGEIVSVYTPDGIVSATSGSCTVTKNGIYLFAVTDEYGNTVTEEVLVTKLDNEAPKLTGLTTVGGRTGTITLTGATDDCTAVYNAAGLVTGYSGSGIAKREYRMGDDGEWTEFTGDSFTVTANGTYAVRLTDELGSVSGEYTVQIDEIDATAPAVTCEFNGTLSEKSGWYISSTVEAVLTFTDEAGKEGGTPSGVASVRYQWVTDDSMIPTGLSELSEEDIAKETCSFSRTSSDNGTWYLYYQVTDHKGNVTSGFSKQLQKDSVAGTWIVAGPDKGQPVSDGLTMSVTLTYGPAGGYLTAETTLLKMLDAVSGAGTGTVTADYMQKSTGNGSFRYYPYAVNGSTGTNYNNKEYYVRQVDFDSQGGSVVESQLVWYLSADAAAVCTVTEPDDPTREGYTFGGWYTDADCTDGREFDFDTTQLNVDTTLYAKWTARTYDVEYHLTNPDGSGYTAEDIYNSYIYGEGLILPVLSADGFAFCGWYDNPDYTGTAYTAIGDAAIGNKEYYAYFRDIAAPALTAELTGKPAEGADGWYGASDTPSVNVSYSDNVAVTGLYVSVDGGVYTELSVDDAAGTDAADQGTADPRYRFTYTALQEGVHTYAFYAVDAAGNGIETEALTVKLDYEKPQLGEITYENKAKNFLDWVIGKESLIIRIPVSDEGSGAKTLTYTQTTVAADGTETTETKTVTLSGRTGEQTVEMILTADWKGTITNIFCADAVGNVSDTKSLENTDGVIVEDNAPIITITVADMADPENPKAGEAISEDYYAENSKLTLYVSVADDRADTGSRITAGIGNITYTINGGTVNTVDDGFADVFKAGCDFTIDLTGYAGVLRVAVMAADNAGNTAKNSVTVKIKGQEATPESGINYKEEVLTGLAAGAKYEVSYTTSDGTEHTFVCMADGNGTVDMQEAWYGQTIAIVKVGNGSETWDSEPLRLSLPDRPAAPSPGTVAVSAKGEQDGRITGLLPDTLYEISSDGGVTWQSVTADENGEITRLAAGSYIVRVSGTDTGFTGRPCGAVQIVVPHTHSGTLAKAEDATCTEDGHISYYICDCGKWFSDGGCTKEVTTRDVTIEALGHDWSGEWIVTKEATATEDGTEETACTRGCGGRKTRIIPATGNPDEGMLEKAAVVAEDAPIGQATLDNEETELLAADGIFTEEEKADIVGGRDARVWLEITKTDESGVSDADKEAVLQAAREIAGDNPKLIYFDVDLFKQMEGGQRTKISEPGIHIKVTIRIPEELLNHDGTILREYRIIRLHNGGVTVIDGAFDAQTGLFSFETDKFSTYAIVYDDKTAAPDQSGDNGSDGSHSGDGDNAYNGDSSDNDHSGSDSGYSGGGDNDDRGDGSDNDDRGDGSGTGKASEGDDQRNLTGLPETGDQSNPAFITMLFLFAMAALAGLFARKK